MSKTSQGKYKRPSKNSKLYQKSKKRIPSRNNFVVVCKFRCINPHATWGTTRDDICTSSVTCFATCKEESGVAGSTFDGGWGTRWWQDVDGGAENKEWVVGVGENGKVGVHGNVTVDRSGSEMLDGGWDFNWDECRVSVEEDTEVGEIMSLVGLAYGIWSKVVLSDEKGWKGGDAVNVCDFGRVVGELSKIIWHFGLRVLLTVIEMKMIGKVFELKEDLISNNSHKLLRPNQFLEKSMEILEWSTLQKYMSSLPPTQCYRILEE